MEAYLKIISENTFTQPVVLSPIATKDLSALPSKAFCMNDSSHSFTSNNIKATKRKNMSLRQRQKLLSHYNWAIICCICKSWSQADLIMGLSPDRLLYMQNCSMHSMLQHWKGKVGLDLSTKINTTLCI